MGFIHAAQLRGTKCDILALSSHYGPKDQLGLARRPFEANGKIGISFSTSYLMPELQWMLFFKLTKTLPAAARCLSSYNYLVSACYPGLLARNLTCKTRSPDGIHDVTLPSGGCCLVLFRLFHLAYSMIASGSRVEVIDAAMLISL